MHILSYVLFFMIITKSSSSIFHTHMRLQSCMPAIPTFQYLLRIPVHKAGIPACLKENRLPPVTVKDYPCPPLFWRRSYNFVLQITLLCTSVLHCIISNVIFVLFLLRIYGNQWLCWPFLIYCRNNLWGNILGLDVEISLPIVEITLFSSLPMSNVCLCNNWKY